MNIVKKIAKIYKRAGIEFSVEYTGITKERGYFRNSYDCSVVDNDLNEFAFKFSCGDAVGVPDEEILFSCLISDARCVQDMAFDDFCSELGYDNDSIKALRIYEQCCNCLDWFQHVFNPDDLEIIFDNQELIEEFSEEFLSWIK